MLTKKCVVHLEFFSESPTLPPPLVAEINLALDKYVAEEK